MIAALSVIKIILFEARFKYLGSLVSFKGICRFTGAFLFGEEFI